MDLSIDRFGQNNNTGDYFAIFNEIKPDGTATYSVCDLGPEADTVHDVCAVYETKDAAVLKWTMVLVA